MAGVPINDFAIGFAFVVVAVLIEVFVRRPLVSPLDGGIDRRDTWRSWAASFLLSLLFVISYHYLADRLTARWGFAHWASELAAVAMLLSIAYLIRVLVGFIRERVGGRDPA